MVTKKGYKKEPFSKKVKERCLQWSNRRCYCGKECGSDIVIHHIDPRERATIDNAIPLCLQCHANIQKYNAMHPIGEKYRLKELKVKRDQIYEEQTKHLKPKIDYEITQVIRDRDTALPIGIRELPDVGFTIFHRGDSLPVKAKVLAKVFLGGRFFAHVGDGYDGKTLWDLNPALGTQGHFYISNKAVESEEPLEIRVKVTIVDQLEREHEELPVAWLYKRSANRWVFQPCIGK